MYLKYATYLHPDKLLILLKRKFTTKALQKTQPLHNSSEISRKRNLYTTFKNSTYTQPHTESSLYPLTCPLFNSTYLLLKNPKQSQKSPKAKRKNVAQFQRHGRENAGMHVEWRQDRAFSTLVLHCLWREHKLYGTFEWREQSWRVEDSCDLSGSGYRLISPESCVITVVGKLELPVGYVAESIKKEKSKPNRLVDQKRAS